MGKKRVPIALRKPPSPDAAAKHAKADVAPAAPAPAAPEPEVAARVTESEVAAPIAEPEITVPVAHTTELEIAAFVAEPEAPAAVVEPEIVAIVAEPDAAVHVAEPPAPRVVEDALQRLAPDAPPAILVGTGGQAMRAVTIYLPAEIVDRLMLHGLERSHDLLREAIEASLQKRLGSPAPSVAVGAGTPFTDTARPMPRWVATFREYGATRGIVARIERWIDVGHAIVTSVRTHVRTAGAAASA